MREAALAAIRGRRPFDGSDVRFRTGPFALMYVAAFALFPLGASDRYGIWFMAAVATALATLLAIGLVPWSRLPRVAQLLPLLSFIGSVALLRQAHGASHSAYAPMVMVAVAWAAFFATRLELSAVILASAIAIGGPPAFGDPTRAQDEFRRAIIVALVAILLGAGVRLLLGALLETESRLLSLAAHELHDDVVQAFAAAQLALELEDRETADRALREGMASAQALASRMLEESTHGAPHPGALRRS